MSERIRGIETGVSENGVSAGSVDWDVLKEENGQGGVDWNVLEDTENDQVGAAVDVETDDGGETREALKPERLYRGVVIGYGDLDWFKIDADLVPGSEPEYDEQGRPIVRDGNEYGVYMSDNESVASEAYGRPRSQKSQVVEPLVAIGDRRESMETPSIGVVYEIDTDGLEVHKPWITSYLEGHYNNGFQGNEWVAASIPVENYQVSKMTIGADYLHNVEQVEINDAKMADSYMRARMEQRKERLERCAELIKRNFPDARAQYQMGREEQKILRDVLGDEGVAYENLAEMPVDGGREMVRFLLANTYQEQPEDLNWPALRAVERVGDKITNDDGVEVVERKLEEELEQEIARKDGFVQRRQEAGEVANTAGFDKKIAMWQELLDKVRRKMGRENDSKAGFPGGNEALGVQEVVADEVGDDGRAGEVGRGAIGLNKVVGDDGEVYAAGGGQEKIIDLKEVLENATAEDSETRGADSESDGMKPVEQEGYREAQEDVDGDPDRMKPVGEMEPKNVMREYLDLLHDLSGNFTSPEAVESAVVWEDGQVRDRRGYSGDESFIRNMYKKAGVELDVTSNFGQVGLDELHYKNKDLDRAHTLRMVDTLIKNEQEWQDAGREYGRIQEDLDVAEQRLKEVQEQYASMNLVEKLRSFMAWKRELAEVNQVLEAVRQRMKQVQMNVYASNKSRQGGLEAAYSEDYHYGHHKLHYKHESEPGYRDKVNEEYNEKFEGDEERQRKIRRAVELRRLLME